MSRQHVNHQNYEKDLTLDKTLQIARMLEDVDYFSKTTTTYLYH